MIFGSGNIVVINRASVSELILVVSCRVDDTEPDSKTHIYKMFHFRMSFHTIKSDACSKTYEIRAGASKT